MTIHGEQFAVSLAYSLGGVKGFDIFAQQAPSCGHCVQFLNEIKGAKEIEYIIPDYSKAKLGSMMKYTFSPEALGLKTRLFSSPEFELEKISASRNQEAASKLFEVTQRSYAPYSQCPGGAIILSKSGKMYWGSYIENVAFNPVVTPFHAALIHMISKGETYLDIERVLIAEKENCSVSHSKPADSLLDSINRKATLEVIKLK
jgi:cytidine deaminase